MLIRIALLVSAFAAAPLLAQGFDAGAPGGDPDGFAAFGHVVEGMDVVNRIFASPTSPTKGEGVMKGQMLEPAIKIIKANRVK